MLGLCVILMYLESKGLEGKFKHNNKRKKWRGLRAFAFMYKGMGVMMENCTQTMVTKLILVVAVNLKGLKLKLGLGSQLDKTRQSNTTQRITR
jgi:hypothetical protein